MKEFPDVSDYNGIIQWQVALPFLDGMICKGLEYVEEQTFHPNWMTLAANPDKQRGAYYYWDADHDTISKARQFVDIVRPASGDWLWLDAEDQGIQANKWKGKPELAASIKRWLDEVTRISGIRPGIYTSLGWWNQYACARQLNKIAAPYWTNDYPLWLAQYHDPMAYPAVIPLGWTREQFVLWQWTSSRKMPGIGVTVGSNPYTDANQLQGTLAEVQVKMSGHVTIPPIIPVVGYKVVVTAYALTIRSGPSSLSAMVYPYYLLQNNQVMILDKVNGWGSIGPNQWISLAWTRKL